ncbi:cytochrome c oxidase accessory protein CcoG [Jeongeupia chitinilytica]|uniref:Ferredoxin n=1 Tax=Jeongeupia chitinilytica TaxID=1041641 RepID=A0ABQ3H3K9_9NEIS|nr:cytochrome c oxidase accessory protein CcoG [Jeongeupia chitinilytica]GHD68667.1 ferredoxin [Jeongeupia chitinilytica]
MRKTIPIVPVQPEAGFETTVNVAGRRKIHARMAHGFWSNWRIAAVVATQLFFYLVPWWQIDGQQALLFDLETFRFNVFGMVWLPQDLIYLAALLIFCAVALFAWTAVAGRLWCGFTCPQTVYTEMFMWIERWVEGERNARIKLDRAPPSAGKVARKAIKHGLWIALALWTGFTFAGYFTPIRPLWQATLAWSVGGWTTFWILCYALITYGHAGWLREQICLHMCPYSRFQSAMFDRDTLVVSYDSRRGEPRGGRRKDADFAGDGLGSCVDCTVCVQVCPTGIDIRNGLQYECIGCGACIDACNDVMDKMSYPRGLIRFTTEHAQAASAGRATIARRMLRPKVLAYAAVLFAVAGASAIGLVNHQPLKLEIARDRGSLARLNDNGDVENVYLLTIQNVDARPHRLMVRAEGLAGLRSSLLAPVSVAAGGSETVSLRLSAADGSVRAGRHDIRLAVTAIDDDGIGISEMTTFFGR